MKKTLHIAGILVTLAAVVVLFCLLAAPKDKFAISKDGVRIAYSVYGKGDPVLVFVHGWCGSRSVWDNQVPYFAKKYKVIGLDLAGHGASGRQRKIYTQEAFGEDVAAVVAAEKADKVILIGHSMSGTVILEANRILKNKVVGLIAIDTLENFERFPVSADELNEYIGPMKQDFAKGIVPFIRNMFTKNADPSLIKLVTANVSASNPKIAVNVIEQYLTTPVIPLLNDVNVPLWCLNADLWPSYPEINSKYLKSYHLRVMRGVGHFLMWEAPQEFNRELDDIIDRIKIKD